MFLVFFLSLFFCIIVNYESSTGTCFVFLSTIVFSVDSISPRTNLSVPESPRSTVALWLPPELDEVALCGRDRHRTVWDGLRPNSDSDT